MGGVVKSTTGPGVPFPLQESRPPPPLCLWVRCGHIGSLVPISTTHNTLSPKNLAVLVGEMCNLRIAPECAESAHSRCAHSARYACWAKFCHTLVYSIDSSCLSHFVIHSYPPFSHMTVHSCMTKSGARFGLSLTVIRDSGAQSHFVTPPLRRIPGEKLARTEKK